MRKKLIIGLVCGTALMIGAGGEYLVTRLRGAQENPPVAVPKPADPLFEKLKKDLEAAKKDTLLPPLPNIKTDDVVIPPPTAVTGPPVKPSAPPVAKPKTEVAPPPLPPTHSSGNVPPPMPVPPTAVIEPKPEMPPLSGIPSFPAPPVFEKKADVSIPTPIPPAPMAPKAEPKIDLPMKDKPLPDPAPLPPIVEKPITAPPVPMVPASPARPSEQTTQGVPRRVGTPENSPWSLHVEIVKNQAILTANLHKKHEFKIVCSDVELQTKHNTLKATGNVKISGEGLQGNCNSLSIPLYEDRLVLDGSAQVRIQKTSANVSSDSETKPASFELNGDTLNLRISELQTAKFAEGSWRNVVNDAGNIKPAVATSNDGGKTWSPYGKLRRTNMTHEGLPVWCLDNAGGQPILHFVTRVGGNLTAYEDRRISVYGHPVESSHSAMRNMLRVSHIALP